MDRKIDIMIVGAPKSGTTTLLRNLANHPEVSAHWQTEMGYFVNNNTYKDGFDKTLNRFFGSDINKVLLAKHVRLMYSHIAINRLFEHNPAVQVVVLIRNPITRAYSEYWYARKQGWEQIHHFKDAIEMENTDKSNGWLNRMTPRSYLFHSVYYPHIERLIKVFGKDQVHVILTDDLKEKSSDIYNKILNLVNKQYKVTIDTKQHNMATRPRYEKLAQIFAFIVYSQDSLLKKVFRNVIPKRMLDRIILGFHDWNQKPLKTPKMNELTHEWLSAYFKPNNQKLEQLLDIDLSSWNINA